MKKKKKQSHLHCKAKAICTVAHIYSAGDAINRVTVKDTIYASMSNIMSANIQNVIKIQKKCEVSDRRINCNDKITALSG